MLYLFQCSFLRFVLQPYFPSFQAEIFGLWYVRCRYHHNTTMHLADELTMKEAKVCKCLYISCWLCFKLTLSVSNARTKSSSPAYWVSFPDLPRAFSSLPGCFWPCLHLSGTLHSVPGCCSPAKHANCSHLAQWPFPPGHCLAPRPLFSLMVVRACSTLVNNMITSKIAQGTYSLGIPRSDSVWLLDTLRQ